MFYPVVELEIACGVFKLILDTFKARSISRFRKCRWRQHMQSEMICLPVIKSYLIFMEKPLCMLITGNVECFLLSHFPGYFRHTNVLKSNNNAMMPALKMGSRSLQQSEDPPPSHYSA